LASCPAPNRFARNWIGTRESSMSWKRFSETWSTVEPSRLAITGYIGGT